MTNTTLLRAPLRVLLGAVVLALLLPVGALADEDWDAGVAAYKAKRYADAAAAFERYVAKVPDAYQGHMMLGNMLLKANQASKAVAHLQKANELKSGDAGIQLALGQALLATGKNRDACGVLGRVSTNGLPQANQTVLYQLRAKAGCGDSSDLKKVAQTKNDAASWAAYGSAAMSDDNVSEAVAAFNRAVDLAPNDTRIRRSQIGVLVRQARTARGSTKDQAYRSAVESARKLVSQEPNYDNQLKLGEVQLGAKMYGDAATSFRGAISKSSSDWLPHYYLGQALTAQGRYDDAMDPLQIALERAGSADKKKVYSQLGFVFEKKKDYAQSIAHYQRAGDSAGVARVQQNQEIAEHNLSAEEHNRQVEQLEEEQERIRREMEEALPGGPPPFQR